MSTRKIHTSRKFEKEVQLAKKRGKNTAKLRVVINLLLERQSLPRELNDHPLKVEWQGYRDLHIEPDWLLIYKIDAQNLWLVRTGTHSDLFGI